MISDVTHVDLFGKLPKELYTPIAQALEPDLHALGSLFRSCAYANGPFKVSVLSSDNDWIAERLCQYIRRNRDQAFIRVPSPVISMVVGDVLDAETSGAVSRFLARFPTCQNVLVRHAEKLNNDAIHQLTNGLTHLQQLSLLPSRNMPLQITDDGWNVLGKHCQFLKSLRLIGCTQMTDGAFATIAENNTGLHELHLEQCEEVRSVYALAQHCMMLATLTLRNWYNGTADTDDTMHMATLCTRLATLTLADCWITSSHNWTPVTCCNTLTALNLSNNDITGISGILRHAPHIKKLDLGRSSLTDDTLAAVFSHCTRLDTLSLPGCGELTNSDVEDLSLHNTTLTQLNLSDCKKITSSSISSLLQRCTMLRSLSLNGCEDAGEGFLSFHNTNLTDLSLKAVHISRPILKGIAEGATRLAILDLGCCKVIGRTRIGDLCRSILQRNTELTEIDRGVLDLVERCQGLVSLNLVFCQEVTRSGRDAIHQKNSRLNVLTQPGQDL